ncbi:lycopene cyclase domain-containing protein [Glaciibacter psychrotolerans]|uniref:Lycopene cyclase domain-containing protein n=1 Tax=Glaciibacter psychrotolerans TaxID=670054 RepID=A0A7Z0EFI5_9MICO|nr:lycopene cyclase domain-containing protein [Leifsonia psychrotolerans]NYJ20727.1 lycopene cyclase domain-containing protein [Leifsonia psychrotolerans]
MTYLLVNLVFLTVALAAWLIAVGLRRLDRRVVIASGIALIVVFVLTAVFDTVMIAVGLFSYDPAHHLGILIGLAPIEDFAYPLGAALLLPALWGLFGGRDE